MMKLLPEMTLIEKFLAKQNDSSNMKKETELYDIDFRQIPVN